MVSLVHQRVAAYEALLKQPMMNNNNNNSNSISGNMSTAGTTITSTSTVTLTSETIVNENPQGDPNFEVQILPKNGASNSCGGMIPTTTTTTTTMIMTFHSTTTTSSVSKMVMGFENQSGAGAGGAMTGTSSCQQQQQQQQQPQGAEELLGTHVSFTEGEDCNASSTSSTSTSSRIHPPNNSNDDISPTSSIQEQQEAETAPTTATAAALGQQNSAEDKLMAAIAQATTGGGVTRTTTTTVFHDSRETEEDVGDHSSGFFTAVSTAVAQKFSCHTNDSLDGDYNNTQEEKDSNNAANLFDRIDQQIDHAATADSNQAAAIDAADKNDSKGNSNGNKTHSTTGWIQDLERVLFFTDVVDRNPPPSSGKATTTTTSSSSNDVSSRVISPCSSSIDQLWMLPQVALQQVCNTVYKSSVEACEGVEKTCKEVERTFLFTDVPDPAPASRTITSSATESSTNIKKKNKPNPHLSLYSLPPTMQEAASIAMEERSVSSMVTPKVSSAANRPSNLRASSLTPENEINRVLKTLEKKLLFTDLPDEGLSRKCSTKNKSAPNPPLEKPLMKEESVTTVANHHQQQQQQPVNSSSLACCQNLQRTLCFTDLDERKRLNAGSSGNQDAGARLMTQIWAEDKAAHEISNDLQHLLQARMEEVRRLQLQLQEQQQLGSSTSGSSVIVNEEEAEETATMSAVHNGGNNNHPAASVTDSGSSDYAIALEQEVSDGKSDDISAFNSTVSTEELEQVVIIPDANSAGFTHMKDKGNDASVEFLRGNRDSAGPTAAKLEDDNDADVDAASKTYGSCHPASKGDETYESCRPASKDDETYESCHPEVQIVEQDGLAPQENVVEQDEQTAPRVPEDQVQLETEMNFKHDASAENSESEVSSHVELEEVGTSRICEVTTNHATASKDVAGDDKTCPEEDEVPPIATMTATSEISVTSEVSDRSDPALSAEAGPVVDQSDSVDSKVEAVLQAELETQMSKDHHNSQIHLPCSKEQESTHEEPAKSWTSQDEQCLEKIMDTTSSETTHANESTRGDTMTDVTAGDLQEFNDENMVAGEKVPQPADTAPQNKERTESLLLMASDIAPLLTDDGVHCVLEENSVASFVTAGDGSRSACDDGSLKGAHRCEVKAAEKAKSSEAHSFEDRHEEARCTESSEEEAGVCSGVETPQPNLVDRNSTRPNEDFLPDTGSITGSSVVSSVVGGSVESGTEKFDVLLAEMKQLESAIDSDLVKAHTVLGKKTPEAPATNHCMEEPADAKNAGEEPKEL